MTRERRIDPPQIALAMPMRRAFEWVALSTVFAGVGEVLVTRGAYALRASRRMGGDLQQRACSVSEGAIRRCSATRDRALYCWTRQICRVTASKQSSARSSN